MSTDFKYRAFISYSHADEAWARWLHRALETYRIPRRLVGRETPFGPVPERLSPVFRDREELPTATNLGATLTLALEQSACQIVICSPKAARSRWVGEEILTFKRLGREHRIFCLIVDGEPGSTDAECFPDPLIFKLGMDGQPTQERGEPIAADVRPGKDPKTLAKLKLVAGMLGVGLDELQRREAQRRQRRAMALAAASLAGMVVTSGLAGAAWLARNEAERQRVRAEAEAETARRTTDFMVGLFKVSDPGEALGNRITAREILDRGSAQIERDLAGQPRIQATLMDTMGQVYTSLGLYGPAIPLVRQALERRRALADADPQATADVAQSLDHLGDALTQKAEYDEAERHLRESLDLRRRVLGPSHPDVARSLSLLADLLAARGKYDEAEPLVVEALAIRRAAYGAVHEEVARSLGDLGVVRGRLGDFDGAVARLREAVDMRRRLHPGAHPDLAVAINNLAWAYRSRNEVATAEPLYREALEMNRRLLGDAHPLLAAGLNNVAFVREARGDYAGAEASYREALAMNRRLLGESHPLVAANLSNLAFAIYAGGRHADAIRLLRESLAMSRHELGDQHPNVAGSAASLAYWLTDERQFDEAGRLLDESLAIRRRAFGEQHLQVARTMTLQANLLLAERKFVEAQVLAAEARRRLTATLPPTHWQVAMATNVEGAALVGLKRYAAAEPLLVQSLPSLAGAPIPDLRAKGRARLAALYRASGRPADAARVTGPAG
jgi:tetratricopeptide (TPR) repeat protein